jgi:DNA-binding transcriptional ArsR family regulator
MMTLRVYVMWSSHSLRMASWKARADALADPSVTYRRPFSALGGSAARTPNRRQTRELRAALSYVLAQARPVTADELAGSQGTHRNVARSRLERLADAGLVTRGYERRTGRSGPGAGRPAKTYAVAPQSCSIEFPQRRR